MDREAHRGRLEGSAAGDSVEDVVARALASEPDLDVELETSELPLIEADPIHLERALANLLDNARKHGGGHGVKLRTASSRQQVRIEITDEGPGVDPGLAESAFEPFLSASPHAGSGLGLAIVRGFVEANGGTVWAESASGGARFVIELPIEPAPLASMPGRGRP